MRPILLGIFVLTTFFMLSCEPEVCHTLSGSWKSDSGQELVFYEFLDGNQTGQNAALITYFGTSHSDTFFAKANYQCAQKPGILDLLLDTIKNTSFQNHLLGLISWNSDSVFSLHYERGKSASERPSVFDLNRAVRFERMK
jgi:hypothetical protein